MTRAEILRRLDELAARGKLAEFRSAPAPMLFTVPAFGEPFDYTLTAREDSEGAGVVIRYSLRARAKLPLTFLGASVLSVWPGVWLTDSLIRTYWSGYHFPTWAWYLPLTVLPLPWMWLRMSRRSRASAETHARELAGRIKDALPGSL